MYILYKHIMVWYDNNMYCRKLPNNILFYGKTTTIGRYTHISGGRNCVIYVDVDRLRAWVL